MMSELPALTGARTGAMLLVEAVSDDMPVDAKVYLDEELLGRAPAKLQGLLPGRHSLKLVCEGYRTVSRSVVLETGMREQIRVTLFKA